MNNSTLKTELVKITKAYPILSKNLPGKRLFEKPLPSELKNLDAKIPPPALMSIRIKSSITFYQDTMLTLMSSIPPTPKQLAVHQSGGEYPRARVSRSKLPL